MASRPVKIEAFEFPPGRVLAGKFQVDSLIGRGWEGEVYQVTELKTGVHRAAKLFYPHRNEHDRALRRHARKLETLRHCPVVVRYHHSDAIRHRGQQVSLLLSELVDGEVLEKFVARQRGKRLEPFQALHLLRSLVAGVEQIHDCGEYHGDLHDGNVLVRRRGIHFDVRVLDLFSHGRSNRMHQRADVLDLVRVLYDITGGRKHYARHPPELKAICCGLKRSLILDRYPTLGHLLRYLDSFRWSTDHEP